MQYAIELINKVPVISLGGDRVFLDTCFPGELMSVGLPVQRKFGIPGLKCVGFGWLKRYSLLDYRKRTLITSDAQIETLVQGEVLLGMSTIGRMGPYPSIELTVNGIKMNPFIDTGAALSYVRTLPQGVQCRGELHDSDWGGNVWVTRTYRVPCSFDGHDFDAEFGDAERNPHVPAEGVVGFDFFDHFGVLIDKVGKRVSYRVNKN